MPVKKVRSMSLKTRESLRKFDLKLRKSPLRNIVFFFFKSLGHQWYHASNIDTWFTFVQHCSRIYFWNVQIWSIYPTNLPWWCYYVLSTVHWELSSDYLEASKIKQYCLFGSLSSLASVARKPHSNDFFQLIFKLDAAIISKIMENCGIFYLRYTNAW